MTALDVREVLADATQGGAYFIDVRDADAMAEAAQGLDYSVTRIDLSGCATKDAVLATIAHALRFPDWFGGNFDALADSLGDLSWLPADGYLLLLEHGDEWRLGDDANFAVLLDVLNEACARWGDYGVPFWALLPVPAEQLRELGP